MKIRLTPRDYRLLHVLESFGYLSTAQVNQILFAGVNFRTVLRRLRKLEQLKLIQRSRGYKGGVSAWYLRKPGADRIGVDLPIHSVGRNSLIHDLLVNDLRIQLESFQLFSQWISGHHLRRQVIEKIHPLSKKWDTIPDLLCRTQSSVKPRTLALEVELSYKGSKRMLDIFRTYFNKPSIHYLWYFVPTISFGKKLMKTINECRSTGKWTRIETWFLWSHIENFQKHGLQSKVHRLDSTETLGSFFKKLAHSPAHHVSSESRT